MKLNKHENYPPFLARDPTDEPQDQELKLKTKRVVCAWLRSCQCLPLKASVGLVGGGFLTVGCLAAKKVLVFAGLAASALIAKIFIPVGVILLVCLLVKTIWDGCRDRKILKNDNEKYVYLIQNEEEVDDI